METYRMEVERIDVVSSQTLWRGRGRFGPIADMSVILRMIASRLGAQEIERAIGGMVGELGFLVLAKIDQGPLVSLLGRPKKMSVYLIGNPVLANRMYELHPAVGLYAPPSRFDL